MASLVLYFPQQCTFTVQYSYLAFGLQWWFHRSWEVGWCGVPVPWPGTNRPSWRLGTDLGQMQIDGGTQSYYPKFKLAHQPSRWPNRSGLWNYSDRVGIATGSGFPSAASFDEASFVGVSEPCSSISSNRAVRDIELWSLVRFVFGILQWERECLQ